MRQRSRSRPVLRPPRLLPIRSLSRLAESLQTHSPVRSEQRHRKTMRSLPNPKEPLNRMAGLLDYLVEEVSSGGSSATATRLGLFRRRSSQGPPLLSLLSGPPGPRRHDLVFLNHDG